MTQTHAPSVPVYGLRMPSEDDALSMLARAVGADGAARAWRDALHSAGAARQEPSAPQYLAAAERLALHDGAVGAIGTALAVRARTYLLLTRAHAGRARVENAS